MTGAYRHSAGGHGTGDGAVRMATRPGITIVWTGKPRDARAAGKRHGPSRIAEWCLPSLIRGSPYAVASYTTAQAPGP